MLQEHFRLPIRPGGFKDHVIKGGMPLRVNDASTDERFSEKNAFVNVVQRCKTVMIVPVVDRKSGEVIGLIELANKRSGVFTDADEQLISVLASHAGLFMENVGVVY